ncbi:MULTISPECIES: CPCC family cysteine-rich protein [unclassified Sphingomonas]|uniref:CPCC family cysteine-rich protein n=1 Tax=Sphingomonas TaxID=13687 RepID=UPI00339002A9
MTTCPVCEQHVLAEAASCPTCDWIEDSDARYVPEQPFRRNVMSLIEAQEHWRSTGKPVE